MQKMIKAALAAGALGAGAALAEPRRLSLKKYTLGAGANRVRLVQFSDIHIGPWMKKPRVNGLVQRINRLAPDAVLFTGDLYDRFMDWRRVEDALPLAQLRAPLGKYAVWGNHDRANMGRYYPEILSRAGFSLLENTWVVLKVAEGKKLCIAGVDDMLFGRPQPAKLRRIPETADYHLLMVHEPDAAPLFAEVYDLILSGHTHGGQVRLPLVPPVTTEMGRRYIRGFYDLSGAKLYVSPGLGCTKLPFRFRVAPEITVFDLWL